MIRIRSRFARSFSGDSRANSSHGFDQETFGQQKLVTGYWQKPWEEFARESPLNERAKRDLIRIMTEKVDYLPGLSLEEKHRRLRKVSYDAFLRDYAKVDPQVLRRHHRTRRRDDRRTTWRPGIRGLSRTGSQPSSS